MTSLLQHMPLAAAYLCQDCNSIGNSASHCPACASGALLALSCVLNREPAAHLLADRYEIPERHAPERREHGPERREKVRPIAAAA